MAKTVDQWMEERDVTVEELSERSGLEPRRVEAIATGRWLAGPVERQRIAAAFELPPDEFLWGHVMSPRNVRYHRFGLKEDFQ
jgi:transcriptional regulator with XRE-family HTH domain